MSNIKVNTLQNVAGTAGYDIRSSFSNRNKLINGAFDIWQRGKDSITSTGSPQYFADRWKVTLDSTSTASNGLTNVSPYNGKDTVILSRTTAGTYSQLIQRIEPNALRQNNAYTLSITYRGYSGTGQVPGSINRILLRAHDAVDAVLWEEDVTSKAFTPNGSTNWEKETLHTFNTGTVVGTIAYWQVYIITDATVANSILEFIEVQLEEGIEATPFEQKPYGEVLDLCKRFYQTLYIPSYGALDIARGNTIDQAVGSYRLLGTELRKNPSVTYSTSLTDVLLTVISDSDADLNLSNASLTVSVGTYQYRFIATHVNAVNGVNYAIETSVTATTVYLNAEL